jgi:YbbR domain-containing protein
MGLAPMEKIVANLRTFLLALSLAVAVWISAVTSTDPDEVRLYPSLLPLEVVGLDTTLVNLEPLPQQVEVTLRAPRSVWQALLASPQSVRAVLDLSGLSEGTHLVPVHIETEKRPLRVVSISPASIRVVLEALISRPMQIETILNGQPAIGYQAGDLSLETTTVTISGPRSSVERVDKVLLEVNLSGTRESIDRTLPLRAVDKQGNTVEKVSLIPAAVHVRLPIQQMGGYRDAVVKVVVRGRVANGYHLSGISVFPPVITIYSENAAWINNLPGVIETEPLDLSGLKENLSRRLSLVLPAGISVIGEPGVLVNVSIEALESSLTLTGQPIEITGLAPGLSASLSPAAVDLLIAGPIPLLNNLRPPQDIQVFVDLTNLGAGNYQLSPIVKILVDGLRVESVLPSTIQVIITPQVTPTP